MSNVYPSAEAAFKKHAESVRTALQTFNALRTIPSTGVVSNPLQTALAELVNTTVDFYLPLFSEQ
jgi:hypothetical protein